MEDFVTFEIAKKLKEKGFRRPCILYYNSDKVRTWFNEPYIAKNFIPTTLGNDDVLAPTISQVMKWLRKEYKIYMYVERDTYHLKFRFVYEKDKPRGKFTSSIYDGFEQAALAGIEYVLDNLI